MPWGTVLCIYRKKIGNICKNNGFVIPSDAIFHLLMATHCSYITIIDYLRFIFWYNIADLKKSNPMRLKPFQKLKKRVFHILCKKIGIHHKIGHTLIGETQMCNYQIRLSCHEHNKMN